MNGVVIGLLTTVLILNLVLVCFAFLYIKLNFKIFWANFTRWRKHKAITKEERENYIKNLTDTLLLLSSKKIGALLVQEQRNSLSFYAESGFKIEAYFERDFVFAIFHNKNASFHDGAILIQDNKIKAVSCYLPVSKKNIDINYGARHRAAVGISEITDAIAFIVSETTGGISCAQKGELLVLSNQKHQLEDSLTRLI